MKLDLAEALKRLGNSAQWIGRRSAATLRAAIGEVRWTPPLWAAPVRSATAKGWGVVSRHPRQSGWIAGAFLLVMVAGFGVWRWYQMLPQPVEFGVTAVPPERTCYECDPPGTPNPAVFSFTGSVAPLADTGKSVDPDKSGISIRPKIAGDWRWADDRTLTFTPKADWPIGETFLVGFARRGFAAPQIRLGTYEATFVSPAFAATVDSTDFYQDPVVASDKKVVMTFGFTHPVDPAALEQRIRVRLFNRITNDREEEIQPAPTYTVTYDKHKLHAYLQTSQLAVLEKGGRVDIQVSAGVQAAQGGNRTLEPLAANAAVPGLYSLVVSDVSLTIARDERDNPSQVLIVGTSHSVTEPEMSARVKAWVLPEKHPDARLQTAWENGGRNLPYRWSGNLVTQQVLGSATPLDLKYVPNEREHVDLHSFNLAGEPKRQIYVQVDRGLRSFGGYLMAEPTARVLEFPEYPREVRIAYQGALVSLSGERKLTLFTRDVAALQVQVGRLLPDQLQHLVTQSRGDFARPQFGNYQFNDSSITERFTDIVNVPRLSPGAANYQALDLARYLNKAGANRQGIFLLNIQAYDPETKQPLGARYGDGQTTDTRLIVVTDMGLLVKRAADGSQDIFVQSVSTGEPVADVTLQVIGRNGEPVLTATTDAEGHVRFPDLRNFKEEKEPVLYLAQRETDSSFLPINSHIQPLNLSRFDVGGISNRTERAALGAYLFSDRGIYRPGDEIRIGAIVKTQDWRALPAGLPLRVEITDPRGLAVKNDTIALSPAGFEDFRYQTRVSAPVGNYSVNLYVVRTANRQDLIGSMTVVVQEFLPDRLRMNTRFSAEAAEGWVAPEDLQAVINLENLFGTPAADRSVRATLRLSPAFPSFSRYPDYQFRDPQAAREGFSENLSDQRTDTTGRAAFDLNLGRFARATYRAGIVVQGFEADGGRGVTGEAAQLVSSLPFLVGWKADGRLDFVSRGGERAVDLVAVDSRLQRVAAPGLKLRHLERRYVSVLLRQENGTYKYESRQKEVPLSETDFALPGGSTKIDLDTATPGSFSYLVDDGTGQTYARIDYTVAGAANLTRSLEKNSELQVVLDKRDYAPGETISLQVQAPYVGAGLITIERDRVYSWQWFKATTTASIQQIKVPEGLEGNGYVSVSFVRDPGSDEIYTAPLSYGVQPFSIALDARRNAVQLRVPEIVKPGESVAIRYRTAQSSRIVLFAVDEGILQVARYASPDPLASFFQKRSLDVSTRQILDLILPEFRASMLSAPGGDQGALLGANLNPFKRKTDLPVAWWSGVLDAGSQEQEIAFTAPDYFNGRLRIMAVAVNGSTIGTAEQATLVRGDFVLSPNTPLTVTPGDEFDVSVGVANNLSGSGAEASVAVTVQGSPQFEVIGPATITQRVPELGESSVRFRIRTQDVLGSGNLLFKAAIGNAGSQLQATVSVRPASAYMTSLLAGSFQKSASTPVTRSLYPEFRTLNVSVSSLPLALAHGLTAYLDRYPYSCTEQLVSQVMPAIVLSQRPEFGELKARQDASLSTLIDELRARQTGDGAFRYWAGGVETVDFVSVYALHVLLEASERGAAVPADLLVAGKDFLSRLARRDGDSMEDERASAYALYLLARQGTVVSNEAAALQRRLTSRYQDQWQKDIVAAYLAAAYQLMKQQRLADQTIARVAFGGSSSMDRWNYPMTSDGMLLYLLAKHFPARLPALPATFLPTLVDRVQKGEYVSLSAATTILALDAYATAIGDAAVAKIIVEATQADRSKQILALPGGLFPKAEFPAATRTLDFGSDSPVNSYYLVNQSGFDRSPATEVLTQGLEIIREFLSAEGQPVTTVKVGDEVTVRVRFRAINRPVIADAVLVDLLPGGFDLVVPSASEPGTESVSGGEDREVSSGSSGCACLFLVGRTGNFPDFADLREDRVVLYGSATDQVQEFSYRIKATNAGTFTVPAAYGESMYDSTIRARSIPGRIAVTQP